MAIEDIWELIKGYSAMAEDTVRESEAAEWSQALIADSSDVGPVLTSPASSSRALI
jgi:hypothetical protein